MLGGIEAILVPTYIKRRYCAKLVKNKNQKMQVRGEIFYNYYTNNRVINKIIKIHFYNLTFRKLW